MTDNPFDIGYVEPEEVEAPADAPRERTGCAIIHRDLDQGSEEWLQARCGLLTASEMKLIITPTLKMASNDKEHAHLYELLAQRITQYVEPHYFNDDMLRGQEDEIEACARYSKEYEPVEAIGFITNDKWGFTLGYSPDGKVIGKEAGIECKSRRQKYQIQTIVEYIAAGQVHPDFAMQIQTGLLVSEWDWIDWVSYSGGLPMTTLRVYPDPQIQSAILEAAEAFETRLSQKLALYNQVVASNARLLPTERRVEQEIF